MLLAGCRSSSKQPERVSNLLDDKTTIARVQQVLTNAANGAAFTQVQVISTNSIVTLRGTVTNQEAKERASQLAGEVPRVKGIKNELKVK